MPAGTLCYVHTGRLHRLVPLGATGGAHQAAPPGGGACWHSVAPGACWRLHQWYLPAPLPWRRPQAPLGSRRQQVSWHKVLQWHLHLVALPGAISNHTQRHPGSWRCPLAPLPSTCAAPHFRRHSFCVVACTVRCQTCHRLHAKAASLVRESRDGIHAKDRNRNQGQGNEFSAPWAHSLGCTTENILRACRKTCVLCRRQRQNRDWGRGWGSTSTSYKVWLQARQAKTTVWACRSGWAALQGKNACPKYVSEPHSPV